MNNESVSAASLCFLFNCFSPAIRGNMSKCVQPDELGKVFAILASAEALVPILASTIYSELYLATKDTDVPGAPYFLSAGFNLVVLIMAL